MVRSTYIDPNLLTVKDYRSLTDHVYGLRNKGPGRTSREGSTAREEPIVREGTTAREGSTAREETTAREGTTAARGGTTSSADCVWEKGRKMFLTRFRNTMNGGETVNINPYTKNGTFLPDDPRNHDAMAISIIDTTKELADEGSIDIADFLGGTSGGPFSDHNVALQAATRDAKLFDPVLLRMKQELEAISDSCAFIASSTKASNIDSILTKTGKSDRLPALRFLNERGERELEPFWTAERSEKAGIKDDTTPKRITQLREEYADHLSAERETWAEFH